MEYLAGETSQTDQTSLCCPNSLVFNTSEQISVQARNKEQLSWADMIMRGYLVGLK